MTLTGAPVRRVEDERLLTIPKADLGRGARIPLTVLRGNVEGPDLAARRVPHDDAASGLDHPLVSRAH